MTVHFQSIVEKFAPHDTIFSFVSSAELKDTKLSAACSLHTASASVKSSTDSLRPPALSEIAEDARENQPASPDGMGNRNMESSWAGEDRRARVAVSKYADYPNSADVKSARRTLSPAPSTSTIRNAEKALPPTPPELTHKKIYSKSTYDGEQSDLRPSLDGRFSFQSARPATRDNQSVYEYKQKIKLGPRPSTESAARSHTLESPRPVSTLPASVRIPTRKAAPTRSKSQNPPKSIGDLPPSKTALSPPLPVIPVLDAYHGKSNGPLTPTRPMPAKTPAITPEKRRLMKALQLRQKQLAAQALKSNFGSEPSLPGSEFEKRDSIMETIVGFSAERKGETIMEAAFDMSEKKDDFRKSEATITESGEDSEIVQVFIDDITKSNLTNVESSPISIIEPSDGPSTQASSITDEDISRSGSKGSDWESPNQTNETNESFSLSPGAEDNIDLDHSNSLESLSGAESIARDAELVDPGAVPLPAPDESEAHDLSSQEDSLGEEAESASLIRSVPENHSPKDSLGEEAKSVSLIQSIPEIRSPGKITAHLPNRLEEDQNNTRPSTGDTTQDGSLGRDNQTVSLKRASTPENSDDHFLSDDSFMEELRSATVQEAKPMSVSLSKCPISPVFPRRPSDLKLQEAENYARSVSSPIQDMRSKDQAEISPVGPTHFTSRSFSASHQSGSAQTQQASAIMLKKVGVSSGISQRIKALEQLSSRPTSPSSQGPSNVNASGPSPALVSLRKASLKSPSLRSDSGESVGGKIRQQISSPSTSSPFGAVYLNRKEKSVNIKIESKAKQSHSDSISVTATIVRDPRNKNLAGPVDPGEPNMMDLCRSPLVVEHRSGRKSPTQPPPKPPRSRVASPRSVSSSSTEHWSETPQGTRRDSFTSKRSVTSGRESEVDFPRSISDTSINGATGHDGSKEEKKESRKSRLFKRMSGMSSASRRSIVQALNSSLREGPIVEHHETVKQAPKTMAAFGDVNIQFPDTLVGIYLIRQSRCVLTQRQLWKRRDMKIDDQGNLVLSQSKADNVSDDREAMFVFLLCLPDLCKNSKVVTKRYPLSDFYPPYVPDQDRQELANSKLMWFINLTGSQAHVL